MSDTGMKYADFMAAIERDPELARMAAELIRAFERTFFRSRSGYRIKLREDQKPLEGGNGGLSMERNVDVMLKAVRDRDAWLEARAREILFVRGIPQDEVTIVRVKALPRGGEPTMIVRIERMTPTRCRVVDILAWTVLRFTWPGEPEQTQEVEPRVIDEVVGLLGREFDCDPPARYDEPVDDEPLAPDQWNLEVQGGSE